MNEQTFKLGEDWLTTGKALEITENKISVILSNETEKKIEKSWGIVQKIVDKGHPVYGINTGFGPLCTTKISKSETNILQTNILQSHSVGVGDPIKKDIAKLMLILKAQSLAKGFSGIALKTLKRII